jgi:CheY-like chemotaxis protein
MLRELKHEVTEACNSAQALDTLSSESRHWDLLITDFAMPHVSGAELVRQARVARPDLPALIITGYAEGDALGTSESHARVLFKPFTLGALANGINEALDA